MTQELSSQVGGNSVPRGGELSSQVSAEDTIFLDLKKEKDTTNRKAADKSALRVRLVEEFNRFWQASPRRGTKAKAKQVWLAILDPSSPSMRGVDRSPGAIPEMWRGLRRAMRSKRWLNSQRDPNDPGRFIPHVEQFLKSGRWSDDCGEWVEERPNGRPIPDEEINRIYRCKVEAAAQLTLEPAKEPDEPTWAAIKAGLRGQMNQHNFRDYAAPVRSLGLSGGVLTLEAPNRLVANMLTPYSDLIRSLDANVQTVKIILAAA